MNKQEMPPATFDIETWFHATHTKSSNGRVPGRTIQYEDMLNIFLYSKMEEMPDGSLDVPGMRCNIPSRDVSKYSVRGIWDSSDFTPVERELAWRQECAKSDNNLVGAVSELKELVIEMSKTMNILMDENRKLNSMVKSSENQREWALLSVFEDDLRKFVKNEWRCVGEDTGEVATARPLYLSTKHGFPRYGIRSHCCHFMIPQLPVPGEPGAPHQLSPILTSSNFMDTIDKLFKLNIPTIYNNVGFSLKITAEREGKTCPPPTVYHESGVQTIGEWLKEIKGFPKKLRDCPDSFSLMERTEIICHVTIQLALCMLGGPRSTGWSTYGHYVEEFKPLSLREEVALRNLAWRRELMETPQNVDKGVDKEDDDDTASHSTWAPEINL